MLAIVATSSLRGDGHADQIAGISPPSLRHTPATSGQPCIRAPRIGLLTVMTVPVGRDRDETEHQTKIGSFRSMTALTEYRSVDPLGRRRRPIAAPSGEEGGVLVLLFSESPPALCCNRSRAAGAGRCSPVAAQESRSRRRVELENGTLVLPADQHPSVRAACGFQLEELAVGTRPRPMPISIRTATA